MMQIVYFEQKDQLLSHLEALPGEKQFITPSPAKADGLRSRLKNPDGADVITVVKFTSSLVEAMFEDKDPPDIKRKAELLLIFGILKDQYLPELSFEQFIQAYNLFSDLRSFTLNAEALGPVLEEEPAEISKAVTLFWKLLELTGYMDEHAGYQLLSETLRSSEENDKLKKTFIFWGFQHMNGQQVDLLKALSIRYDVIIPFPATLKSILKRTDWISWLLDSHCKEIELGGERKKPEAKWLQVNSREIALSLKNLLKDGDQILLGVSKLAPSHIDIVPTRKVFFKVPHELIHGELLEVHSHLKTECKGVNTLDTVLSVLSLWKRDILADKKRISFKLLKGIELYESAIQEIRSLSDAAVKVDLFFLKLLHEVVGLNQPRTSFVPMASDELTMDLADMSMLENIDRNRRVLLCIDERFEDIQGLGQNYPESIQKALGALAPLKRNELELQFKKWEFDDLFSHSDVTVLMNPLTLKHSLVWKKLFHNVELKAGEVASLRENRKLIDHYRDLPKKNFEGSFSASKFQSFHDCQRRFYFSYVDKVFPSVTFEQDFDSLTSGSISHRIIELYLKEKLSLNDIPNLTRRVMDEYISENHLELAGEAYLQWELLFNHRSTNGIIFLENLASGLGEQVIWHPEVEFDFTESYSIKGKIDCIGITDQHIILLDFKSTKSAAHNNTEIENLDSLQLWAYAKAASMKYEDFLQKDIIMGFVSLDRPKDSNLFHSSPEVEKSLKALKLCTQGKPKKDFRELFQEAGERMQSLALAIQSEKHFMAQPRKDKVCTFCELNKVCVKSVVNHE
ncbi:MAG: PD-(D/E)XK nuclease family protein [Bdellovibrionota bacterium]